MQCKKAAVDREILVLHELVQRQHDAIASRLDGELARAKADCATLVGSEVGRFAELQKNERREQEERVAQEASDHRQLLRELEGSLAEQFETKLASTNGTWEHELQQLSARTQQIQETQHERACERMKEELEHQVGGRGLM